MDWIYWIKLVHTIIFFIASGCIVFIVYCGIVGKTSRFLRVSIGLVFLIGLVYAVNGFECPISTLVYWLAGQRDVPDILFPDWFARNIMPVSTVVYVIGVALVLLRRHRKRKSNKQIRPTR